MTIRLDPTDFGAKGDGITDDTRAFQIAAIGLPCQWCGLPTFGHTHPACFADWRKEQARQAEGER